MNISPFMTDLAQLLEINADQLNEDFQLESCFGWDSLTVVSTIALLDQHFSVQVGGEVLEQCKTIGDLLRLAKETSLTQVT